MYKSKLQELCQRRGWILPEYSTKKQGLDHNPQFSASISVNGEVYETPELCRSSKEAQNSVARLVFEKFMSPAPAQLDSSPVHGIPPADPLPVSPVPSSLPFPPAGLLAGRNFATTVLANKEVPLTNYEATTQDPVVHRTCISSPDTTLKKDTLQMYKNRLQQYSQKKNLSLPVYSCEVEGPPHQRRFKSRVSLEGKSFETSDFFATLKEAEQAAAKVACQALLVETNQEGGILYKNLLQEFAQKRGLPCPTYGTISSGKSHQPVFVSTVEIGSDTFRGTEANTKKQAEMIVAKIAYHALTKGSSASEPSEASTNGCNLVDNSTQNIMPTATTILHHNIAHEESQEIGKKAKFSPAENIENVDPSNGDSMPTPVQGQTSSRIRTIVFPRSSGYPIPQCASVLPYSDDQWVAYKVGMDQKPTA